MAEQYDGVGRSRGRARGQTTTEGSHDSGSLGRGRGPPIRASTETNNSSGSQINATCHGIRRGMERGRATLDIPEEMTKRLKELSIKGVPKPQTIGPPMLFADQVLYDQIQCKDKNVIVEDKHAGSGNKIKLQTNILFLQNKPDWKLYSYSVDFKPELDSKMIKKVVLKQHNDILGGPSQYLFDGTKLWTKNPLDDGAQVIKGQSTLKNEDVIKFRLRLIAQHDITDPISLQVYNLHFHRYQEMLDMKEIRKRYFFPQAHLISTVTSKGHKFQIWPGLIARINRFEKMVEQRGDEKIYEDRPALLIDTISKVVRQESCYDVIKNCMKTVRGPEGKNEVKRQLVGSTIITGYNNSNYRIDDVNFDMNPESTFDRRGQPISYKAYYQEQYSLKIKDPKQPLFQCRPKKRQPGQKNQNIYIIPELASPTGLTDAMRNDFGIMKDLATKTRKSPNERFAKYKDIQQQFMEHAGIKLMMKEWGLRFEKSGFAQANGTKLKPQDLNFTKNGRPSVVKGSGKADWDRDLKTNGLLKPPPAMKRWVFIGTKKSEKAATEFSKCLVEVANKMGWELGKLKALNLLQSDRDFKTEAQKWIEKSADFIVCFVPRENKGTYDTIKKMALKAGVGTQFIKERTAGKNTQSVATKVALQMACKMGGEAWGVSMPKSIKKKAVMYVGIDVFHDTQKKSESVYALVASMNKEVTRWYSTHSILSQTQEIGSTVGAMLIQAMEVFKSKNEIYPGQIFIYRDGVGDTDLERVKCVEISDILKSLDELKNSRGLEDDFGLTFGVVKKRIDHKFMAITSTGVENPPAGTVCDTVLTKKIWYDFFLVSQQTRQGTVTPIHVNIIHDTIGMKADKVHELTFKLTHLYYNWPGTVRVPAPVQYAHKLASLIGECVHGGVDVAPSMKDKLYYL